MQSIKLHKSTGHYLLLAFSMFALFAACANLAIILHEAGHYVVCRLLDLTITEVKLRPFSASFVSVDMGNSPPWKHIAYHGSGIVLGTFFVLPLLWGRRAVARHSALWLILTATFAFEMGLNAAYLLLGAVMPFGDAQGMVVYGVPKVILIVMGIPLLVAFAKTGRDIFEGLGLSRVDGLGRWLLVASGIPAYFPLMIGYTAVVRPQILSEFPKQLAMIVVFTTAVIGAAAWSFKTSRNDAIIASSSVVRRSLALFSLACLVIGSELLFWS